MPRKPLDAFEHGGRLENVGAKQTNRKMRAEGAPFGLARLRAPYFERSTRRPVSPVASQGRGQKFVVRMKGDGIEGLIRLPRGMKRLKNPVRNRGRAAIPPPRLYRITIVD